MINLMSRLIFLAFLVLASSCAVDGDPAEIEIFSRDYNFSDGLQGWNADFTDYPVAEDPLADTVYRWNAALSHDPNGGTAQSAYMISCRNVSGDVFMFIKKKVDGLRPNTNYSVVYEVSLSTDAVAGQGIILKCGASELEPKKVIEDSYYVLNVDKGDDTTSGENAISLGDIGSLSPTDEYNSVTKGNINAYQPFVTRTNSKGELWLFLGTDSLYEGTTTVYFHQINFIFSVTE